MTVAILGAVWLEKPKKETWQNSILG